MDTIGDDNIGVGHRIRIATSDKPGTVRQIHYLRSVDSHKSGRDHRQLNFKKLDLRVLGGDVLSKYSDDGVSVAKGPEQQAYAEPEDK